MLIGFCADKLDVIREIADSLDLELTVFARVRDNDNRFGCVNHHK